MIMSNVKFWYFEDFNDMDDNGGDNTVGDMSDNDNGVMMITGCGDDNGGGGDMGADNGGWWWHQ